MKCKTGCGLTAFVNGYCWLHHVGRTVYGEHVTFIPRQVDMSRVSVPKAATEAARIATEMGLPAEWRSKAICRNQSDLFYEMGKWRTANKLCEMCPVAGPCLAFALVAHELEGIWGGFTAVERRAMFAERSGRVAASSCVGKCTTEPPSSTGRSASLSGAAS